MTANPPLPSGTPAPDVWTPPEGWTQDLYPLWLRMHAAFDIPSELSATVSQIIAQSRASARREAFEEAATLCALYAEGKYIGLSHKHAALRCAQEIRARAASEGGDV